MAYARVTDLQAVSDSAAIVGAEISTKMFRQPTEPPMPPTVRLLDEHNSACERARLSDCNCFCHGAGHQLDLLKRAVSCVPDEDQRVKPQDVV